MISHIIEKDRVTLIKAYEGIKEIIETYPRDSSFDDIEYLWLLHKVRISLKDVLTCVTNQSTLKTLTTD